MRCQTRAKVVLRALHPLCRTGLTARVGRDEFGYARALPATGSSFQSGLLLTLFCYSVLTMSGCGRSEVGAHDTGTLAATPTSVAFGNVTVGQASNAKISLQEENSGPVEITQLSLSGQGFALSGQADLPFSVPAGGSYDLSVQFNPVATGAATGQSTVTSNSSTNATVAIALSGTGIPRIYVVDMNWDAPLDSADPVAGYNVFMSPAGCNTYELSNSSVDRSTTFVDSVSQNGLSL
jgi:hypothetical protein